LAHGTKTQCLYDCIVTTHNYFLIRVFLRFYYGLFSLSSTVLFLSSYIFLPSCYQENTWACIYSTASSYFQDILRSPNIFHEPWFPLVYDSRESNQQNLALVQVTLHSNTNPRFKTQMLVGCICNLFCCPLLLTN
jgi:hypothetical protein